MFLRWFIFLVLMIAAVSPSWAADKESVFERVKRTGEIRCGYTPIGRAVIKDPNTGAVSGIVHDIVEEIGKNLSLKIVWAEEIPFGNAVTGLQTGRFDVFCSSIYARPNFMMLGEMTMPYYYVPVNIYVRQGDKRFKTRADIDKPAVKVSYQDGTIPSFLRASDFPHSGEFVTPDMDYADQMMAVATGKADVTFLEPSIAADYMKNHPNTIEVLEELSPLRLFPAVLAMNKGEHDLVTTLSWAINFLHDNGRIEAILQKYEAGEHLYTRVAPGYQLAE